MIDRFIGFDGPEGIMEGFEISGDPPWDEVLVAIYDMHPYDGQAEVIFRKDGKLFWAGGGHCSCYGLEGQWNPTEMTLDAIRHIAKDGTDGAVERQAASIALAVIDSTEVK